jgi:hypothetical protein
MGNKRIKKIKLFGINVGEVVHIYVSKNLWNCRDEKKKLRRRLNKKRGIATGFG